LSVNLRTASVRPRPAAAVTAPRRAAFRLPGWAAIAAIAVISLTGLVLFGVPLRHVDLGRMSAIGLVSVLPAASLAGIGLLVLAFVLALGPHRARPVLLGAMLVAIVLCLHGVTSVIESQPRFATGYQIAGFAEYVGRTGHTAPGLYAYFSWPGFFALVAFAKAVAGGQDLLAVLRFWPVVINLAYLVPIWLILRNLRASWRAKWFAALLFTVGLWVGQDYFSPQSFDYLLYLLFVAFALTWFRSLPAARQAGQADGWLSRLRWRLAGRFEAGELPARPAGTGERAVLLGVLIAIFAVVAVSHQLTPFFLLGACAGLVLVRRSTLTGLPVLFAVILVGWLSFAATGFWSGHLSDIFGGIGHLGGNVTSGVGGRLSGASPGHELVLYLRVGFAAVMLALAGAGLLRRRRRLIDDRVALVLTCVPFLALGLQNYGGEIVLRVYMFALPAASVLAAYLFFPNTDPSRATARADAPATAAAAAGAAGAAALPTGSKIARAGRAVQPAPPARRSWPALVAAAACAIAMTGGFLIARYGNEAWEQTPRGELAAMNYLYAHDRGGARVLWLSQQPPVDVTPQLPWQYRDIEKIQYQPTKAPVNPAAVGGVIASLRAAGPGSYLITSRTQRAYLQQVASYQPGWGREFRAQLSGTPGVRTVFANQDAAIYTLRWPPGATASSLNLGAGGQAVQATSWTPIGLAVLGLLLLVLLAREFIRVSGRAAVRYIRPLTLASLPLLAALFVIVIERFIVLS
jgi:hypothetical protein